MRGSRRLLAVTAILWLSCQIGSVMLTPLAAWAGVVDLTDCTCPHGVGAACPMHQKSESGSKVCVMRAVNDQAIMVLGSMFGLTPPAPKAAVVADPVPAGNVTLPQFSLILVRPPRPEAPPPRA